MLRCQLAQAGGWWVRAVPGMGPRPFIPAPDPVMCPVCVACDTGTDKLGDVVAGLGRSCVQHTALLQPGSRERGIRSIGRGGFGSVRAACAP